jgi:hypothetical protein
VAREIRSIDFYDDLAKWTAIEGLGECVETVSGIDDGMRQIGGWTVIRRSIAAVFLP